MDSAIIAVLTNGGVAGVVVILMILGWLVPKWVYSNLEKENKHLREALDLERQRNKEAISQVGVTNQLIGALVDLAGDRQKKPELTGKDSLCAGSGGSSARSGSTAQTGRKQRSRYRAAIWKSRVRNLSVPSGIGKRRTISLLLSESPFN